MKLISTHTNVLLFATLFTVFASANTTYSQVCSNPTNVIYALSNSGNILPVTVSTTSVGTALNAAYPSNTSNANGLGYNAANGKFYYFQVGSNGGSQLFVSFDPTSNQYTTLASAPITAGVNRGCVNFNGSGYYCLDQNGNLCYYDIAANTWTLITSVFTDQYGGNVNTIFKSQGSGDIAIDGLGNLWIVTSNSSKYGVYKISAPLPTAVSSGISIEELIAPTTTTPGTNFAGIAFNSTGQIYVCTPNDLYLLQNNYTLTHLGAFSIAGIGGDLTSCSFPITVLPVSWTGFTATVQAGNTVQLQWSVATQLNNKGYSIEHSQDGLHWENIGFKSDNGMSDAASYAFTDNNPFSGKNYYRIQQEDVNGKSSYSETKSVDIDLQGHPATWPNPAKDVVNIQYTYTGSANLNAEIFNQSGQKIATTLLHSGTNAVNIATLSTGYYIIHIGLANGESYNQKLIKL